MAKKPFTHKDLNLDVRCSHPHCAKVHGIEGIVQHPIKKNVIARAEKDTERFICYACQMYDRDGLTLAERKKRKEDKREQRGHKVLTAETT